MRAINLITLVQQDLTRQRYIFYLLAITSLAFVILLFLGLKIYFYNEYKTIYMKEQTIAKQKQILLYPNPTQSSMIRFLSMLNKIATMLPYNTWLTQIKLNDKRVRLTGNALQMNSIVRLKDKLKFLKSSVTLCHFIVHQHSFLFILEIGKSCRGHKGG